MVTIEQLHIGTKVKMTNDYAPYDRIAAGYNMAGKVCTVSWVGDSDFKLVEDEEMYYYITDCIDHIVNGCVTKDEFASLTEGDVVRIVDSPAVLRDNHVYNPNDYCGKEFTVTSVEDEFIIVDPDGPCFHRETIAAVVKRVDHDWISYDDYKRLKRGDKVTLVKTANDVCHYAGGLVNDMYKNFGKQVTIRNVNDRNFWIDEDVYIYDWRLIASIDDDAVDVANDKPAKRLSVDDLLKLKVGDRVLVGSSDVLDHSRLYANYNMKKQAGKWLTVDAAPWKEPDEPYVRVRLRDDITYDADDYSNNPREWFWSNEMLVDAVPQEHADIVDAINSGEKVVIDKDDFDAIMRILKKYGGD